MEFYLTGICEMSKLESLILNYNRITSLPDSLCKLKQLQILWLSGNAISLLPPAFGELKNLDWTWWCTSSALDGNPLKYPPMHVAKQGPGAIAKYFQGRKEKPTSK